MATKIQLRRGNASAWTSTNPVLSSGEFGVESDTVRFKIGDGSNTWSNLAYFYSGEATTTTVSEGANLYFTNTRAVSALTPGTGINIGANGLITSTALGGVTSVNGANGNVQLFYSNNTFPNVNTLGTIWYKPDDGNIFILVNDGTANVWLEIDTPFFDYNSNTTDIPEGANLYFTNTRAISSLTPGYGISIDSNGLVTAVLSGAGSGNITEVAGVTSGAVSNNQLGAAVYGTGVFTTANVIESGNLYFTNNRAISSLTPGYGIEIAANGRVTALLSAVGTGNITEVAGVTTGAVSNVQLGLAVINSGALNTSNVVEGSNLYFTNTRAVSALTPGFGINIEANGMVVALLSGAGSGNITEVAGVTSGAVSNNQLGAAVYGTGVFTTSNVIEGANLYFTNTRAISSLTAGSGLSIAANGLITSSGAVTSVAGQIGDISNAQLASALTNSTLDVNSISINTITSNTWSGIYTANVIETSDNLYFTNTRAIGALTAGRGIEVAANGQITSLYNIESIAGIANGSVSNVQLAFAIQDTALLNTDNIAEGANLYFTNTRVYANVIDIGFATNTYVNNQLNNKANTVDLNVFATNNHVTAVVNLLQTTKANNEDVTNLTTGNIPENGNLYFTNTRAISALYTDSSLVLEPNGRIIANVSAIGGGTITSVGGINSGSVSNAQLASALNASTIAPDNVTVTGTATIQSLRVNGDMTVDGIATFITSTTVAIDDKNIVLANGAADASVADGAGISISGAYANLTYYVTSDRFNFNKNVDILGNTVLTNAITTTNLTEGANLYFTNTRAREAFTAGGGVILDANGMVSISSGNVGSIASFAYTPAVTNIDVGFFLGNYLMTPYSGLNPEITVLAGTSLAFDLGRIVSITNHPFTIKNVINGVNVESGISLVTSDGSSLSGAAAQGKTSGRMFWRVPRNLAGNVYVYQSTANSSVSGNIRIILGDYASGSGIDVNANGMILNTEQYANSKVKSYLGNVDGDIVPAGNEIYNLGAPTRRWANLYLAGNTIILGDTKIQSSGDGSLVIRSTNVEVTSSLSFASNGYIASKAGAITTSNVAEGANLYFTNNRVYSNVIALGYSTNTYVNTRLLTKANVSDLTTANVIEDGNLYFTNARVYANVIALDYSTNTYVNTRLLTKANVADLNTSNIVEGSNLYFTNARVLSYLQDVGGNIVPAADLEYSLGTPSRRWKDLYISGNTVYLGNALIEASDSSVVLPPGSEISGQTTDNVIEGNVNVYYTNTRARAALSSGTGVSYDKLTGAISIGQNVSPTRDVTFANLIVTGNLLVQGNIVEFTSNTLVINDPLIQVGKSPVSDTVDLGFFGHYIGGSPSIERHAGLFRDASDGQFKLFTNLDPEPATIVDTANTSYQSANLVVNYVVGKVTDISNHTTSSLAEGSNLYFTNTRAIGAFTSGQGIVIASNGLIISTVTGGGGGSGSGNVLSVNGAEGNIVLFTTSNTEPTSNLLGSFWYKPDHGNLYLYINDGQSNVWIEIDNPTLKLSNAIIGGSAGANVASVNGVGGNVVLYTTSNTEPTSNVLGSFWYKPATGNLYLYINDGQANNWIEIDTPSLNLTSGSGSSGANVASVNGVGGNVVLYTTSNTEPTSNTLGSFWFKPDTNNLYFYINDGQSNVWIEIDSPSLTVSSNNSLRAFLGNVDTDLIPSDDEVYSLGSPAKKWSNLYLSGNTIILGSTKIESSGDGALSIKSTNAQITSAISFASNGYIVSEAGAITTSNVAEGANLYFTNARVYGNVITLGYATNTYVNTRLLTKANVADLTTSNIIEGSNLYFTNTRVVSALTAGANISIAANGMVTALTQGGGGGSVYDTNTSSTGYLALSAGTTAQRPVSPANGAVRLNTTTGYGELYFNGQWLQFGLVSSFSVEYLVVAGGGAGGTNHGGGGGAGGYRTGSGNVTTGTSYTITVGAGGTGGGTSGADSTYGSITSTGGGGGGGRQAAREYGANGGSGGGGSFSVSSGQEYGGTGNSPSTSPAQGTNGGAGNRSFGTGGGGGGATSSGSVPTNYSGAAGGGGTSSSITGSSVAYAGGGGGAGWGSQGGSGGPGGSGGGGAGSTGNGTAGTTNRGGGGGGGGEGGGVGGNGGSGIVILKYPSSYTATFSVGLTTSSSTSAGFTVSQITGGTGTVAFS